MNWQITKLHGDFWNNFDEQSFIKRGWMGDDEKAKNLSCLFKAWDEDDDLCFSGKVTGDLQDWEDVFDALMSDSGITRVVFYDNKGNRIDEIS